MFWASVATIARLFTRHTVGTSESSAPDATNPSDKQDTSSTQREGSDTISRVSLREWPSTESLVTGSSFSEAMSDSVTVDQQRREEKNAMALKSPVSEELIRTGVGVASDSWILAQFQPDGSRCKPRACWVLEST